MCSLSWTTGITRPTQKSRKITVFLAPTFQTNNKAKCPNGEFNIVIQERKIKLALSQETTLLDCLSLLHSCTKKVRLGYLYFFFLDFVSMSFRMVCNRFKGEMKGLSNGKRNVLSTT